VTTRLLDASLLCGDIGMYRVIREFSTAVMFERTNDFFYKNICTFELIGVCMRIFSFGLVSWFGSSSPFLFVWAVNTLDAVLLTWCSLLKQDKAYTLLNGFWVLVGIVGIARAGGLL
jgi:hypothetical protein